MPHGPSGAAQNSRSAGYVSGLFEENGYRVDMELIANIIGLSIIAGIAAIAIWLSNRYARRRVGEPLAVRRLKVPCDPVLHTDFLNALTGEKIQFVPPTQPEPSPTQSNQAQDPPLCVVLVAEEDYARAEQILVGFQRKWLGVEVETCKTGRSS